MARPTVLVADSQAHRRQELAQGLASFGYEVVAAGDEAEAKKFALGLSPHVIVAESTLPGFADGSVLAELSADTRPLLVLMVPDEAAAEEVPEEAYAISTEGLTPKALLRKVRTVLVGKEVGLAPDERLESLLGDESALPLFDLLPLLQKAVVTGRVLFAGGELALEGGEVIAARLGRARGVKALARMGRAGHGTYRVLLGLPGAEREMSEDLLTLMATAIEDQHAFAAEAAQFPSLEARVQVVMGPGFFATHFTAAQQQVLEACQDAPSVREVLDRVPLLDGQVLSELARLRELGFVAFAEPELRVRVVTDSTADLPPELVSLYRINVVPLTLFLKGQIHKDGVDITPREFYKRLIEEKDLDPRTSPPTPGEFLATYRLLVPESDVVSVHISEKQSKTITHAREAVQEHWEELQALRSGGRPLRIEVVDTRTNSGAEGLLVLFAARMAFRGLSAEEIRTRLEEMRDRVHLLFVVDTLEYLARGGRIGKARALVGQMLRIKPILTIEDGEVAPLDKVRGGRAAHPRIVEILKGRVDTAKPVIVGVAHAQAPVWAGRLKDLIQQNFTVRELLDFEIGPTIGTHVGPGTVGVAVFQPKEDEEPLIAPLPAA